MVEDVGDDLMLLGRIVDVAWLQGGHAALVESSAVTHHVEGNVVLLNYDAGVPAEALSEGPIVHA